MLAFSQVLEKAHLIRQAREDLEVVIIARERFGQVLGREHHHPDGLLDREVVVGFEIHHVALAQIHLKIIPFGENEAVADFVHEPAFGKQDDDIARLVQLCGAPIEFGEDERELGVMVNDQEVVLFPVGERAAFDSFDQLLQCGREHGDNKGEQNETENDLNEAKDQFGDIFRVGITGGVGEETIAVAQGTHARREHHNDKSAEGKDGDQLGPDRRHRKTVGREKPPELT